MIKSKKILIFALLFPILFLFALVVYKKYILYFGKQVILPISGYDPVDPLSGHYLIYRIDYGVKEICSFNALNNQDSEAYVCLEPKMFSSTPFTNCALFIRGQCKNGHFVAGIERFYIPEEKSKTWQEKIDASSVRVVISVTTSGQAVVKDLMVDEK